MGLLPSRPRAASHRSVPHPHPRPTRPPRNTRPPRSPAPHGSRGSSSPNHSAFQHHLATFLPPRPVLLDGLTTTPPIGPALTTNHRPRSASCFRFRFRPRCALGIVGAAKIKGYVGDRRRTEVTHKKRVHLYLPCYPSSLVEFPAGGSKRIGGGPLEIAVDMFASIVIFRSLWAG